MLVATVSKRSKSVRPATVIFPRLPCDSEQSELNKNNGAITMTQAFQRLRLKRSCINAIETSAMEIVEVNAATMRKRKNKLDHN